jgi:hypothetical protein
MPQIFHPVTNTISRVSVFGAVVLAGGAFGLGAILVRSPYATEVGVVKSQPVPFSHQHHVAEVGMDCRYCHRTVEREASAGMPTTEICLGCHSQLWVDSEMLSPLHQSLESKRPLQWVRVHDLPDFVYFHHGAHISQGITCETCHGRVDRMPLTWRNSTLHMEWCLDCHRNPEHHVRPANAVIDMGWERGDREAQEAAIDVMHHLRGPTHCSACHR